MNGENDHTRDVGKIRWDHNYQRAMQMQSMFIGPGSNQAFARVGPIPWAPSLLLSVLHTGCLIVGNAGSRPAATVFHRTCQKCQSPPPTTELPNQKLWDRAQQPMLNQALQSFWCTLMLENRPSGMCKGFKDSECGFSILTLPFASLCDEQVTKPLPSGLSLIEGRDVTSYPGFVRSQWQAVSRFCHQVAVCPFPANLLSSFCFSFLIWKDGLGLPGGPWLRLLASTAGEAQVHPGLGTKVLQACSTARKKIKKMDQQVLTCMLHSFLLCASHCPKHVNILILFSSATPVYSLYFWQEKLQHKTGK